jgi:hypothetical protein
MQELLSPRRLCSNLSGICSKSIGLILSVGFALASSAHAAVIIDITQQGSDVVVTGSGTIDSTDLLPSTPLGAGGNIDPSSASVLAGPISGNLSLREWQGINGPTSFGNGPGAVATSGSGDLFGVAGLSGYLYLPGNYSSGVSLSATDTYSSSTISGLGLTPGTYVYTWGTGADADSLTVQIGVPEPSTWAMMILGFLGLGWMTYRRRGSTLRIA